MTTLFHRLIDDAAMFPPGNAPIDEAVLGHRVARAGADADLVGRFVIAASRLAEVTDHLRDGDRFELAVVLDGPADGLSAAYAVIDEPDRASVVAVEAKAASAATVDELAGQCRPGTELFVETPLDHPLVEAIATVGASAKFRTGGIEASAFPSEDVLGHAIVAAVEHGLTFKCTAGLHHAVRHTDASTGFEHHGFLNVLVAVHRAISGGNVDDVVAALGDRDPGSVARAAEAITEPEALRQTFAGFGSCSLAEPAGDLRALGLR